MRDSAKKTTTPEPRTLQQCLPSLPAPADERDPAEILRDLNEQGRQIAADHVRSLQAQSAQRRMQRAVGHAGIPPRFADRTLGNYRTDGHEGRERALQLCRSYVAHFDTVLERGICAQILGGPGTGKTHLACGILNALLSAGRTGMFVGMGQALRMIRSTYRPNSTESEQDVIDRLTEPDLLVLDEVGVAIGRDETRQTMLYDVIDARYAHQRPAILMGNMTAEEMDAYLGERMADRLRENGGFVIACSWESYRRSSANKGE